MAGNPMVVEKRWEEFRLMVMRNNSEEDARKLRGVFYAGALCLFQEIQKLDPGTECTDADLQRMDWIDQELKAFCREIVAKGGAERL